MRKVAVLLGSKSDEQVMAGCTEYLAKFGIPHDLRVSSAHRQPDETAAFVKKAEADGYAVIIAAAGMAAHLAGFAAAHTTLPVIGVPLEGSALNGVDALYSTVQMPPGIPVATVAIGSAGAKNAAVLAAEILALNDDGLRRKLAEFRSNGAKF
jgi:phosphoribosylaminoimidazole carboxylase PurE protein